MRDALVEALRLEGYDVDAAADGAQGLSLARQHRPDVILLDLMMPIMSGWEFRAAQVGDPRIAEVPVIVMSAYHNDLDVAESLPKPFRLEDMLGAIHRHAG
jgi:CheY-like chemotaxis protein